MSGYYPEGFYEFVRDNSYHVTAKEMAKMVNEKYGRSFSTEAIHQYRFKHGIKSGIDGRYKKGDIPMNKGKKITDYMSPEAIERTKKTRFQKGVAPSNKKPIGTIADFGEYNFIKINDTENYTDNWKLYQRYVWEQHNGDIPEGYIVTFKDGDRNNCNIDNLALISKGENAQLTTKGYRFSDAELTEAGINIIRLENAIKKLEVGD